MKAILLTTSGRGVQSHIRSAGRFEIRGRNQVLSYTSLEEAYRVFLEAEEEVTLWDATSITELLESKVIDN